MGKGFRYYNGHPYREGDITYKTKAEANKSAKRSREMNYKVRIVKKKKGYKLYRKTD